MHIYSGCFLLFSVEELFFFLSASLLSKSIPVNLRIFPSDSLEEKAIFYSDHFSIPKMWLLTCQSRRLHCHRCDVEFNALPHLFNGFNGC